MNKYGASIEFLLSQVRDSTTSLSGGKVYFYSAGTTTAKTVWLDRNKTTPAANPYTLDANGTAQIFADGLYRIVIKNVDGVTVYDRDNVDYAREQNNPWADIRDYDDLADAVTKIGGTAVDLIIQNAQVVNIDLTVPANIRIVRKKGGSVSVSAGKTLTINGEPELGDEQFFYGDGTATIGTTKLSEIKTVWWPTSVAIAQAVGTGKNVLITNGAYSASNVNVGKYQQIRGESREGVVITSPADTKTFIWSFPSTSDSIGPSISNMTINSDYPITINELTTLLADGSGDAPCLDADLSHLTLYPVTTNGGTGITTSKMFDSQIHHNLIVGFNNGIILHGSDLNSIHDNRIIGFKKYGILDQSAQTFGSQNDIHHNDILNAVLTGATFIKSTSRHVSIHDNYMEQSGGAVIGFVDVTSVDIPVYGTNEHALPLSIVIKDNRVDGEALGGFVYRIDGTQSVYTVCENRDTTASVGTSYFVTTDVFTPTDNYVPVVNASNSKSYYVSIAGASWGVWNGVKSYAVMNFMGGVGSLDARQTGAFINADQTYKLKRLGNKIIMPADFTGTANMYPTGSATDTNFVFATGVTYTFSVWARTKSGSGDTLRMGLASSAGGSLNDLTLTNQFKLFTFTAVGPAADVTGVKIYCTRSTANGDIEIANISWKP